MVVDVKPPRILTKGPRRDSGRPQASFVIATIIPITTKTTIAACVHIQNGDTLGQATGSASRVSGGGLRTGGRLAGRVYREGMASFLPKPAAALAVVLLVLAWLAPSGDARLEPSAHRSTAALLGGVNIDSVSQRLASGGSGSGDRHRKTAAREGRAHRSGVVGDGAPGAGPDRSARAGLRRSPGERRGGGWHPRDHDGAEHALLGVLGSGVAVAAACVAGGHTSEANAWPPRDPADYAAFVAYLAARYGTRLAAIEIWNEPDQANEDYFAGPNKVQRYAAVLRAAYPAIKAANPQVPVLGRLARGPQRRLPARAVRGRHQGLLRRPVRPLLHPDARLTALDPRSAGSQTATTRRCG